MRQAVFSSIASRVAGACFLDLFAGSGAYGLEAVSRGAARGIFVEKNPKAVACIKKNIEAVCKSVRRDGAGLVIAQADALSWALPDDGWVPDIVFIDPPYETIPACAPVLFSTLSEMLRTEADPVIIFEMPGELTLEPSGWSCVKRLGKGARQPTAAFFRKTANVETEPKQ
jgi:16S rRNA (guanine966-N2)-methyltransferase